MPPKPPELARRKYATRSLNRPAWPAEHTVAYFHFRV